jgi:CDP-6-deoxy-D-xylo-4-hexulose-3-dehydrase
LEKAEILEGVLNYERKILKPKKFVPYETPVPVSGSILSPEDIANLVETALTGWVTEGQQCAEFSQKLKKYTGIHHCVLCNSGSSANLLAMSALIDKYQVPKNSLIVTSALAFQTTIAPIIQKGMIPLFVDVDWHTLNPDVNLLMDLAERKDVKGIIIAHTLGFPIRKMELVANYYHERGKFVIEDCCDALGACVDDKNHVGVFGDAATFSFFPAHQLTTGEGGAVLTNDGKLFAVLRSYCNWGRDCWCKPGEENTCGKRFDWDFPKLPSHFDHKYIITKIGYNLKMTDMQAAIGNSQINRISEIIRERLGNYYYLLDGFKDIPNFTKTFYVVHETEPMFTSSPFGVPVICMPGVVERADLISFLDKRKIQTRPLFTGNITKHPMMQHVNYESHGALSGCNTIMEHAFWLGCHLELSLAQLDFVLQSFDDYLVKLWKK